MGDMKQINIKYRTYYFFNDMINIKDFDSSLLKIDNTSFKNTGMYNVGYITLKKIDDYENINGINALYLMIGKVIGHIKENNENKYLIFYFSDENKEVLKKYKVPWDGIKNRIESKNDAECKYGKDFTKIRFDTDDDLPLIKPLNLLRLTMIVRSVFEGESKFYLQVYLDECLYECLNARIQYFRWKLIFQMELMLIK